VPKVINMRGRRGVVPPGAVYVGPAHGAGSDLQGANGGTRSRSDPTVREVVAKYRAWFLQQPDLMAALPSHRQ